MGSTGDVRRRCRAPSAAASSDTDDGTAAPARSGWTDDHRSGRTVAPAWDAVIDDPAHLADVLRAHPLHEWHQIRAALTRTGQENFDVAATTVRSEWSNDEEWSRIFEALTAAAAEVIQAMKPVRDPTAFTHVRTALSTLETVVADLPPDPDTGAAA